MGADFQLMAAADVFKVAGPGLKAREAEDGQCQPCGCPQ
jgi:hypothetical protein